MKKENIFKILIFVGICGVIALLYKPIYNSVLNLTGKNSNYSSSDTYKNKKNDEKKSEINERIEQEEIDTSNISKEELINNTDKETKEDEKPIIDSSKPIQSQTGETAKQQDNEKENTSKNYILEKENNVSASEKCFDFDIKTGTIKNYSDSIKCPKNLIIPEKINNVFVTKIGANAFKNKGIVSVELSKRIVKIEDYAFYGNNLNQIVITYNVKEIGDYAFGKNKLKAVISKVPQNRITISKTAFLPFKYSDIEWPEVAEIPPSPVKTEDK